MSASGNLSCTSSSSGAAGGTTGTGFAAGGRVGAATGARPAAGGFVGSGVGCAGGGFCAKAAATKTDEATARRRQARRGIMQFKGKRLLAKGAPEPGKRNQSALVVNGLVRVA